MNLEIVDMSPSSKEAVGRWKKTMESQHGHVDTEPRTKQAHWYSSPFLFTHSLATCLALVLWDAHRKKGSMVHITTPRMAENALKKMMRSCGNAFGSSYEAAIVGEGTNAHNPIANEVKKLLASHEIPLQVEELRKHYSKAVLFNVRNGRVVAYWTEYSEFVVPVEHKP